MKKGFTLVELLAVIVILAVILVIAVPQINNVIKQTKINGLASTAKLIAAKAEEKTLENEVLESNEALTCANLVKLDDNYGNCSVSIVNGKGTVTLVGSSKFAGITCTGTKDNMVCTEGNNPEYVYAFDTPIYEYEVTDFDACKPVVKQNFIDNGYDMEYVETYSTNVCNNSDNVYNQSSWKESASYWFKEKYMGGYTYTVKDGKTEECETYLADNMKDMMIDDWNYTSEQAQAEIEAVCSNSNDVNSEPEKTYSTSDWFSDNLGYYGIFSYEDVNSFLTRSENVYDPFIRRELVNIVQDYSSLEYREGEKASVFARYDKNANFDRNTIIGDTCFIYKKDNNEMLYCSDFSNYQEEQINLKKIFGEENCSINSDNEFDCRTTFGNITIECRIDESSGICTDASYTYLAFCEWAPGFYQCQIEW